jgi:cytochrome d ubiquinol oxidase subunit I
MVAIAGILALLPLWAGYLRWRTGSIYHSVWLLYALIGAAPLGFVAVEAGWVVTEVGRQPWIIYRVMRTADAVTPMPGLVAWFSVFSIIYAFLAVTVAYMLWRQVMQSPSAAELAAAQATV